MTNLEIDKALALAIGWTAEQMKIYSNDTVWLKDPNSAKLFKDEIPFLPWRKFSHKDPAVIWPIAERFAAFPYPLPYPIGGKPEKWDVLLINDYMPGLSVSDNPATAVALAVIEKKAQK